jgi:mRNA-degrading endonuclease toxin of MazEF toxin-antitoxin module
MAVRVLVLQVVVNDLSSGILTATVERAGRGEPIQVELEPGQAHTFQLGPLGVDLILTYNDERKRVPIERTTHLILASEFFPPKFA